MLAGMTDPNVTPPKKPAGVRLSVTITADEYVVLQALKAEHRKKTGKVLTTQQFVSELISQQLKAQGHG